MAWCPLASQKHTATPCLGPSWGLQQCGARKEMCIRDRNPATLPDGLTDGDYMRICMAMVDAADLAVFLPDYQESRGAMVEWAYCQRIGKDCAMYLDMKKGE